MIPKLIQPDNALWAVLPSGVHVATLDEVASLFGFNAHRMHLLNGFRKGVENLFAAGCSAVYLDGSFVTSKPHPGDFDACWEPQSVKPEILDPVLLDFDNKCEAQKQKYFGEFFPNTREGNSGLMFLDFFQRIKETGGEKGVIKIINPTVSPSYAPEEIVT